MPYSSAHHAGKRIAHSRADGFLADGISPGRRRTPRCNRRSGPLGQLRMIPRRHRCHLELTSKPWFLIF